MAASMKVAVFWVVVPWSLVEDYRRFKGSPSSGRWLPWWWSTSETSVNFYQTTRIALMMRHLWNVGKLLPDYTAQQPRRQPSSYSLSWESEISLTWKKLLMYWSLVYLMMTYNCLGYIALYNLWMMNRKVCSWTRITEGEENHEILLSWQPAFWLIFERNTPKMWREAGMLTTESWRTKQWLQQSIMSGLNRLNKVYSLCKREECITYCKDAYGFRTN
jgi:hypothetical protein